MPAPITPATPIPPDFLRCYAYVTGAESPAERAARVADAERHARDVLAPRNAERAAAEKARLIRQHRDDMARVAEQRARGRKSWLIADALATAARTRKAAAQAGAWAAHFTAQAEGR
jgi:hypothetical protein